MRSLPATSLLLLLLMTGCSVEPAPTAALDSSTGTLELEVASKGAVLESATGSGHFNDPRAEGHVTLRIFSFSAVKASDGTTSGQWQLKNPSFPVRVHGTVECLTVIGNEAWFAGTTTQSDRPGQIGVGRRFRVVDNGEGGSSVADQFSLAHPGSAQVWCDSAPEADVFDIEHGNIQVR